LFISFGKGFTDDFTEKLFRELNGLSSTRMATRFFRRYDLAMSFYDISRGTKILKFMNSYGYVNPTRFYDLNGTNSSLMTFREQDQLHENTRNSYLEIANKPGFIIDDEYANYLLLVMDTFCDENLDKSIGLCLVTKEHFVLYMNRIYDYHRAGLSFKLLDCLSFIAGYVNSRSKHVTDVEIKNIHRIFRYAYKTGNVGSTSILRSIVYNTIQVVSRKMYTLIYYLTGLSTEKLVQMCPLDVRTRRFVLLIKMFPGELKNKIIDTVISNYF